MLSLGNFTRGKVWIEDDAGTSIEKQEKNNKIYERKGPWTDIHDNPCLSTHDAFIKLSHMKVICGRWQHTRRNRFDAAPMKFVHKALP